MYLINWLFSIHFLQFLFKFSLCQHCLTSVKQVFLSFTFLYLQTYHFVTPTLIWKSFQSISSLFSYFNVSNWSLMALETEGINGVAVPHRVIKIMGERLLAFSLIYHSWSKVQLHWRFKCAQTYSFSTAPSSHHPEFMFLHVCVNGTHLLIGVCSRAPNLGYQAVLKRTARYQSLLQSCHHGWF